ncbi:hypothetical protein GGX14DRAFT_397827 [Mycena pura]|uniref:Peptidase C14 caspase domain-containing protein n=1 Tax=Mycena pura TaxID=153505 RepID=A0AAD6VBY8_9AGAR|nr:hypothetical protein GGX14DRAFT_397827 [Mycena pura]
MSGIDDNPTDLDELERLALLAIARLLRNQEEPQDDFFREMEELTQEYGLVPPYAAYITLLSTQSHTSDDAAQRLGPGPPREVPTRPTVRDQDYQTAANFESALWQYYKLTGVLVPDELLKECQRRLRIATPGSNSEQKAQRQLQFLDGIHRYRKQRSISFASEQPIGLWADAEQVDPTESMQSKGNRFWAVLIGNDAYPGSPLGGAINDANLVQSFITTYLSVPNDHIRLLRNAKRDTIVNALYDLRDNPDIQRDDNILSAADYFQTPAANQGSQYYSLPRLLSFRWRAAFTRGHCSQIKSETWDADISSFVQLAACQDFQLAEETNVDQDSPHANVSRYSRRERLVNPRYGRFTWALICILKSTLGVNATYASAINSMGVLGPMQVPVVVGSRKESRLWFE